MQKYKINKNYFETISSNMVYLLGYLTADGCVTDNNRLVFQCKSDDVEILQFIKNEISPKRPIQTKLMTHPIDKNKQLEVVRFEMNSKELVDSLKIYNIVPRKTGKEIFPDIPKEYYGDYLRGLLDGDGCVSIGKYLDKRDNRYYNHQCLIFCSANKQFLQDIQNNICLNYGCITYSGNCYQLRIGSKKHIKEIFNIIYNNRDSFYLKRKFQKFLEIGCN